MNILLMDFLMLLYPVNFQNKNQVFIIAFIFSNYFYSLIIYLHFYVN